MKLLLYTLVLCSVAFASEASCPCPWKRFKSYCYLVNSYTMSWFQAHEYCKAQKSEMVKINSAEENEFVLALAREKAPSLQQIWIGLKYNARGKGFYWSDHSALTVYKNWAPKEPNGYGREPCINMWTGQSNVLPHRASGYWNDLPCAALKTLPCGVVCKKLA